MQDSSFYKILSFLHGASIAFIALGTFVTFTFSLPFGIPQAVSLTFLFIFLSLVVLLLIDSLATSRAVLNEQKKQTQILQKIENYLDDQELSDN